MTVNAAIINSFQKFAVIRDKYEIMLLEDQKILFKIGALRKVIAKEVK